MGRISNTVAVVTGGALGIGRACAWMLAHEGAKVAVTDTRDAEREDVVAAITAAGGVAAGWRLDVAKEDEVARVFAAIEVRFGPIGILVNNAGIAGTSKPTDEISEAEWDHVMAVNVKGVFFCTKHVIASMRRAGKGSIVNLSSIYGLVGAPDAPPYHASKGAVRLMTKTDALLYAKDNIRVNSVHPGFIWTPMVANVLAATPDPAAAKAALAALHPLGRLGDAEDVACGVLYLAGDESKFVTGSELVIDGGYTAR